MAVQGVLWARRLNPRVVGRVIRREFAPGFALRHLLAVRDGEDQKELGGSLILRKNLLPVYYAPR